MLNFRLNFLIATFARRQAADHACQGRPQRAAQSRGRAASGRWLRGGQFVKVVLNALLHVHVVGPTRYFAGRVCSSSILTHTGSLRKYRREHRGYPHHARTPLPGGVQFFSWLAGRNHKETYTGCIVSSTTATRCSLNWVRSTSLRSVAL